MRKPTNINPEEVTDKVQFIKLIIFANFRFHFTSRLWRSLQKAKVFPKKLSASVLIIRWTPAFGTRGNP